VVLGSGAAGLTLALSLPRHLRVAVFSKGLLSSGSTSWAQGGIAAVLEEGDSFASHVEDTLIAGAGLCRQETVEFVVSQAPQAIDRLVEAGVNFNPGEDAEHPFHLTREGGHSHRRIVHVDDATGAAIQKALETSASARDNISLFENRVAVDLITHRHTGGPDRCHGVYVLNERTRRVERFLARATALATGGASRVYQFSTNPDGSTGDGIAMAWRAGCRVANLEFNQFHPTCLYHNKVKSFLLTEALRGEGAVLRLLTGERFMERYDQRLELAPRDIVARAIDSEMKRTGARHLLLDISHKPADFIMQHFPTIYQRTRELGFDMTKEGLPVVPAAHYTCGGVITDLAGRTDLPGRSAKRRTRACMGRTDWRLIRCWSAWCSALRRLKTLRSVTLATGRRHRLRNGMKAG
jgi:L-aspartate oxidase